MANVYRLSTARGNLSNDNNTARCYANGVLQAMASTRALSVLKPTEARPVTTEVFRILTSITKGVSTSAASLIRHFPQFPVGVFADSIEFYNVLIETLVKEDQNASSFFKGNLFFTTITCKNITGKDANKKKCGSETGVAKDNPTLEFPPTRRTASDQILKELYGEIDLDPWFCTPCGKFTKQVSMGGNHVFGPLLVVGIQRLGGGDGKKNETKFKNCLSVFVEKGDSQIEVYQLRSIVIHRSFGHYLALVRVGEDFVEVDDQLVHRRVVLEPEVIGEESTMLFYEKVENKIALPTIPTISKPATRSNATSGNDAPVASVGTGSSAVSVVTGDQVNSCYNKLVVIEKQIMAHKFSQASLVPVYSPADLMRQQLHNDKSGVTRKFVTLLASGVAVPAQTGQNVIRSRIKKDRQLRQIIAVESTNQMCYLLQPLKPETVLVVVPFECKLTPEDEKRISKYRVVRMVSEEEEAEKDQITNIRKLFLGRENILD